MRNLAFLFLVLLLSGCNAPQAVYDYDDQVDFSQFRTYAVYPELVSGLSPLDEERLIQSLRSALEEKGLPHAEDPDLFVNIYTQEYQEPSRNNVGIGVGGGSSGIGWGISGGIPVGGPDTYLDLTFDLIDADRDELVWQAVVRTKFDRNASPEKRRALFDKIVEEALEGYPPE